MIVGQESTSCGHNLGLFHATYSPRFTACEGISACVIVAEIPWLRVVCWPTLNLSLLYVPTFHAPEGWNLSVKECTVWRLWTVDERLGPHRSLQTGERRMNSGRIQICSLSATVLSSTKKCCYRPNCWLIVSWTVHFFVFNGLSSSTSMSPCTMTHGWWETTRMKRVRERWWGYGDSLTTFHSLSWSCRLMNAETVPSPPLQNRDLWGQSGGLYVREWMSFPAFTWRWTFILLEM